MVGKDLEYASSQLKNGNLVAIPTETVYGLAANAYDESAILKVFEVKNRPKFDPLIVHVPNLKKAQEVVKNIPEWARLIAKELWPGSLSILLPKKDNLSPLITSGLDTVAIRVPNHPLTLQLLRKVDFPLVAPSANPFGHISPTSALHVEKNLGEKISYILDGGLCTVGIESTIVGEENGKIKIFRQGGIETSKLEKLLGTKIEVLKSGNNKNPSAPGMLKSHYAPKIPLQVGNITSLIEKNTGEKIVAISFKDDYSGENVKAIILSKNKDLHEAAKNFFHALHHAESLCPKLIIAEWMPEEGLGKALNDKLKRASCN